MKCIANVTVPLALFVVILLQGPTVFAERSPFETVPDAAAPPRYNYPTALENIKMKGLIHTNATGVAVFEKTTATNEKKTGTEYLICKKGDTFAIVLNNIRHTFRVHSFKGKKVVLIAGNNKPFEVMP